MYLCARKVRGRRLCIEVHVRAFQPQCHGFGKRNKFSPFYLKFFFCANHAIYEPRREVYSLHPLRLDYVGLKT